MSKSLNKIWEAESRLSSSTGLLQHFQTYCRDVRVTETARELQIGIKRLERIFKREIGLTPKTFQRIRRIQSVIAVIEERPDSSLTKLAYDAGFSDQPHFIREFRSFTGESPRAFAKRKRSLTSVFTG